MVLKEPHLWDFGPPIPYGVRTPGSPKPRSWGLGLRVLGFRVSGFFFKGFRVSVFFKGFRVSGFF